MIAALTTQWVPLSASVNSPIVCGAQGGPSSITAPLLTTNICVTVDSIGTRCGRRPSTPPSKSGVHRNLGLAPRPHDKAAEQPSLASVGGGMAAGAAFTHPRAADARVRPIFL